MKGIIIKNSGEPSPEPKPIKSFKTKIYDIEWTFELVEAITLDPLSMTHGATNYNHKTIKIAFGVEGTMQETIFHEITHAIIFTHLFWKEKFLAEEVCQLMKHCEYIYTLGKEIFNELTGGAE